MKKVILAAAMAASVVATQANAFSIKLNVPSSTCGVTANLASGVASSNYAATVNGPQSAAAAGDAANPLYDLAISYAGNSGVTISAVVNKPYDTAASKALKTDLATAQGLYSANVTSAVKFGTGAIGSTVTSSAAAGAASSTSDTIGSYTDATTTTVTASVYVSDFNIATTGADIADLMDVDAASSTVKVAETVYTVTCNK